MTAASATPGTAHDGVLDLGRVHVLAAGHDHVLHPVVQVEVAVLGEVAGVARSEPAVLGDRLGRLGGVVPVAHHHLDALDPHLADLPGPDVLAVGPDGAELDPRVRLARRAEQLGTALRVVVDGVELHDGAGGLGQAVHLHELGRGELRHRVPQHLLGDGGRAVGHELHRREVVVVGVRHDLEERQHGRHVDGVRDAVRLDLPEDGDRVDLAVEDHLRSHGEAHEPPARAGDVEGRHHHVGHGLRREVPVLRHLTR